MFAEQYRLKPEAYKAYKKKIVIATGPIFLTFALPIFYFKFHHAGGQPTDWKQVSIIGSAFVVMAVIGMSRLLIRQKKAYNEFVLIIDDHRISGQNLQMQPIDFSRIEIMQIVKNSDGSILLYGGAKNEVITIPAAIENKEQLEANLNNLSPVIVNPVSFLTQYFKFLMLVAFAILIVFIYSTNKIVVGITGPILMALSIWLVYAFQRPASDPKMNMKIWRVLLALTCIGAKLFLVFTDRL